MPPSVAPWILSCGGDTIKLWDVGRDFWTLGADGCHVATVSYLPVAGSAVLCAKWNHTNYVVASVGEDPRITMWTAQGQKLGQVPEGPSDNLDEKVNTLCFSKRSRVMITAGSSHLIRVWDMKRRVCVQTLAGHAGGVTDVAVNLKDEQLASVSEKGTICLHSLNSGVRVALLKDLDGQALQVVEYSPHARQLFATAGDGGAVHLWNALARKVERSWRKAHSAPVMGLSFSPTDPKVLVTVGLDKRLLIFDPTSNGLPAKILAEVPLSCCHFKDDGATVAVGTTDGRILFYDVRVRVWKTQMALQAFKKSVQVTCLQWQSFLHSDGDESDSEPPARPLEVTFQPEVDLRNVPANLRGSDRVLASLGSALLTPRDAHRESDGANGTQHTPVHGAPPSEMDVFSPLVEVQPITPYVPRHWEGNSVGADFPGGTTNGVGQVGGSRRPSVSRLSFTDVGNRMEESLSGARPSFGESASGGASPSGRAGQNGLEGRPGETPGVQFSSVNDLRQEAKRKLQASISAKVSGGARPGYPGEEPRGSGLLPPTFASHGKSGLSSLSGPLERDTSQDAGLLDPSTIRGLAGARYPSFDQMTSGSRLPPRYSTLPTSTFEATPSDRGLSATKPGSFTSTLNSSARLLAEPRNPPPPELLNGPPREELRSYGTPSDASRALPQHDVTSSTFGSPFGSAEASGATAYPSAARLTPPNELSRRDAMSPDWLTTTPRQNGGPQESTTPRAQTPVDGLPQPRPEAAYLRRNSFAAESSSSQQGPPQAPRPDSIEPPSGSETRLGGLSHPTMNGSPQSRRPSDVGFGADRGVGVGRRQEFGQGKDVRWRENAIVELDVGSRPLSELQSVAPTPHHQPFSLQLVQRALEDSLAPLQRSFHQEIHNLHLELLRQFHIQQGETQTLVTSILERQAALEEEVKALRKENQQLKHFF